MRLELSRKAQADLADIRDYSVDRFGPARADAYIGAIEKAFRLIVDHPQIGTVRNGVAERMRSLPSGEHRIFYSLEEDHVLVVRVLHKRMDVERHL